MADKISRDQTSQGSRHSASPTSVKVIVRKLLEQADHRTSGPPAHGDRTAEAERVIFDTEVDGVRCLLIRSPSTATPRISLSPREQEIARMVAKGFPNKTIASVLEISSWTVNTYLRRMFAKVGVCSRAALVGRLAEHANTENASVLSRPAISQKAVYGSSNGSPVTPPPRPKTITLRP